MLSELNLPKLPDGFRWRFYISSIGNPILALEKHVAFGKYSEIGSEHPQLTAKYSRITIEEAIQKDAEKLYEAKRRWWEWPDVTDCQKYVGTA
jgi:hypothetical protein